MIEQQLGMQTYPQLSIEIYSHTQVQLSNCAHFLQHIVKTQDVSRTVYPSTWVTVAMDRAVISG